MLPIIRILSCPASAQYNHYFIIERSIYDAVKEALKSTHRLICEVEDVAVEEGGLALLHRHARLRVPEVGVRGELI